MITLKENLPLNFNGLDMMWAKEGVDIHDTTERALYNIYVATIPGLLNFFGGIKNTPFDDTKWLKISEQHLLEFTSGVVYKDDIGELTKARDYLRYYPDNVLRFLLVTEWSAIGGDWYPMGRIAAKGDKLGLRIQTAKVIQHLMRIAFRLSKKYYPYKKWFGTIFKSLQLSSTLEPLLLDLAREEEWQKIEEKIHEIVKILMQEQNKLGLTPEIKMFAEKAPNKRHHVKVDYFRIGNEIAENIQFPLKNLRKNMVGQFNDINQILWGDEVGKWAFVFLQKS